MNKSFYHLFAVNHADAMDKTKSNSANSRKFVRSAAPGYKCALKYWVSKWYKNSQIVSRDWCIKKSFTPVARPIFETKNRAMFLERFFGRGISGEAFLPYNLVPINWLWSGFIFPELEHL